MTVRYRQQGKPVAKVQQGKPVVPVGGMTLIFYLFIVHIYNTLLGSRISLAILCTLYIVVLVASAITPPRA